MPAINRDTEVAEYTLFIRQGRTFAKTITIDSITSLTGVSVRAMIKKNREDSTALITLVENDGIVTSIVASKLNIVLTLTPTQTDIALDNELTDQGYWDLEVTQGTSKKSFIEGSVIYKRTATR